MRRLPPESPVAAPQKKVLPPLQPRERISEDFVARALAQETPSLASPQRPSGLMSLGGER
jgi:hypothetical protein